MDRAAQKEKEEPVTGGGQEGAEQKIVQNFGDDDGGRVGDGIVVNVAALFFPYKTLGNGIDGREKNGDPKQGAPHQGGGQVLPEVKGKVADKGRAEQI